MLWSTTPASSFLTSRRSGSIRPASVRCSEHVRRAAEEREATVLLSTHLLAEVEETCSRVLILNRGRVAAEGTVVRDRSPSWRSPQRVIRVAASDLDRAKQALTAAGIAVESVELEGARLSDAFLAMTESD